MAQLMKLVYKVIEENVKVLNESSTLWKFHFTDPSQNKTYYGVSSALDSKDAIKRLIKYATDPAMPGMTGEVRFTRVLQKQGKLDTIKAVRVGTYDTKKELQYARSEFIKNDPLAMHDVNKVGNVKTPDEHKIIVSYPIQIPKSSIIKTQSGTYFKDKYVSPGEDQILGLKQIVTKPEALPNIGLVHRLRPGKENKIEIV